MSVRSLEKRIPSFPTSDGAGVKLRRSIGVNPSHRHDPFLMLDEFGTDRPEDYIAGFPPHPHRGFETVTYMLDGHMQHRDHLGNVGELTAGGVQWMTTGRGIIHSEMPQQQEGRMRGFQLWINLPANEKMKPASYRDIPAERIPEITLPDRVTVKIIAGTLQHDGKQTTGPIDGVSTRPVFFDIRLPANATFKTTLPDEHHAFLYPYEGSLRIGNAQDELNAQTAGILSLGAEVVITAGDTETRTLLLAGHPLREPIAQYGPFVMNTQAEIEQALRDYRDGTLATEAQHD